MKKRWARRYLLSSVSVTLVFAMAACSSGNNGNNDSNATKTPTQSSNASGETPSQDVSHDPLGKYDPPIEVSVTKGINGNFKLENGESYDDNVWTQGYKEELGIKLKYKWYIDNSQYDQKIGLDMAATDLPDFFSVNKNDFQTLAENGMLADLSEVYRDYASPILKGVIESDPKTFESMHYDGKLLAVGQPHNLGEQIDMIWIREDWLHNLGLSAPKTMNDVLMISEAFTKRDPDQNQKDDTYGLGLTKDLFESSFAGLKGFANGYHAYPGIWIKDNSGKIAYGSVQPEMKTTLQALQDMYKKGDLDKEFAVKDGGKVSELTTNGKLGMVYGLFWIPGWPLNESKAANPGAEWKAYPIVSSDDQPVLGSTSVGVTGLTVVSKSAAHPEALIKLLNFGLETGYGESAETEFQKYHMGDNGRELFHLSYRSMFPVSKNIDIMHKVSEAVANKDGSNLRGEEKNTFDSAMKWVDEKSASNWVHYSVFGSGEQSAMAITEYYEKNNLMKVNEFYSTPTPTMMDKWSTLTKLESEVFTKIIMGESIASFDEFVKKWHSLGGDEIIQEVNNWYNNN
jgi:putative aldouronate transport system substrate-binding protein